jgi:hypothetical protein
MHGADDRAQTGQSEGASDEPSRGIRTRRRILPVRRAAP